MPSPWVVVSARDQLWLFMRSCSNLSLSLGIPVTLENPGGSSMWATSCAKEVTQLPGAAEVVFDMCRFGERYRKRTKLLTGGFPEMLSLAKQCTCTTRHVTLSGWADRLGQNRHHEAMPTSAAAAYPKQLCAEWAALVAQKLER